MAYEIRAFQCLIPASTPISAPVVIATAFPPRIVRQVEITVPPGPSGAVGFAISVAGQNIIPYNSGAWIVTDNEKIVWDLQDQIDSGAWQFQGYNTGQYPHTIYIRYLLDTVTKPAPGLIGTLLPASALSSSSPVAF